MGSRGPIPMPSEDLARPLHRRGGDAPAVLSGMRLEVVWPAPDPEWHPIAVELYESAQVSGQSERYQQTDIAVLRLVCFEITSYLSASRRNSNHLAVLVGALKDLLFTEGDRLRSRVELAAEAPVVEDATVTLIQGYKDLLSSGK